MKISQYVSLILVTIAFFGCASMGMVKASGGKVPQGISILLLCSLIVLGIADVVLRRKGL